NHAMILSAYFQTAASFGLQIFAHCRLPRFQGGTDMPYRPNDHNARAISAAMPARGALVRKIGVLISAFLFAVSVGAMPAHAQKGYSGNIPPDLVDKGKQVKGQKPPPPKLREPKCKSDECLKIYNDLKAALEDYYQQKWEVAQQARKDAGQSDEKGAGEAQTQSNNARQNLNIIDPGGTDTARKARHDKSKEADPANGNLDKLSQKIAKLLADLKKCEKDCPPPAKTAETPAQPATPQEPTPTPQPEQPLIPATGKPLPRLSDIKLPTVPPGDCWKEG